MSRISPRAWRIARDTAAVGGMGSLLLLYFAFGAGVVYSASIYCDYAESNNVTVAESCGFFIGDDDTGLSLDTVRGVSAAQNEVPTELQTDTGPVTDLYNAIVGFFTLAFDTIRILFAVIAWPAMALVMVPGLGVFVIEVVTGIMGLAILIAILNWIAGRQ